MQTNHGAEAQRSNQIIDKHRAKQMIIRQQREKKT